MPPAYTREDIYTKGTVADNTPHIVSILMTNDRSKNKARSALYLDGVLQGTFSGPVVTYTAASTNRYNFMAPHVLNNAYYGAESCTLGIDYTGDIIISEVDDSARISAEQALLSRHNINGFDIASDI